MRLRIFLLIAVIIVLAVGYPIVAVRAVDDAQEKIAPWVMNATQGSRTADFIVVLSEQADTSGAAQLTTKAEKGRSVFELKKSVADATQGDLKAYLSGLGKRFRAFYIVNAILVEDGDRQLALDIAGRRDVARIVGNPEIDTKLLPAPAVGEGEAGATDAPDAIEWGILNTRAPEVWGSHDGTGIVIGGEDTGYRWTHVQLKSKYRGWDAESQTADHNYNWHDAIHTGGGSCGPNSPQPCDPNGHGTHTMGTMVGGDGFGPDPNDIGMASGAKWIGCRNMQPNGAGTPATYMECHEFMLAPTDANGQNPRPDLAPHVLNNSWGCPVAEGCDRETLRASVNTLVEAGIVYVAAAGNTGPGCGTVNTPPASYQSAWSIGAINISNQLAAFSSRGLPWASVIKPDISAPGVGVRSAGAASDTAYTASSGTSMAAPHAVGAVALLLQARPDLIGDVWSVRNLFESRANPNVVVIPVQTCGGLSSEMIPNNSFGWGRIDVAAAIGVGGSE